MVESNRKRTKRTVSKKTTAGKKRKVDKKRKNPRKSRHRGETKESERRHTRNLIKMT